MGSSNTRNFVINLGQVNNPYNRADLQAVLKTFKGLDIKSFDEGISTYEGEEEATFIIRGTHSFTSKDKRFNTLMMELAVITDQECIAYKYGFTTNAWDDKRLAYHPRFKERFDFNESLFLS